MFFEVARVVGFFASPSNFLLACGLVALLLMATRFARLGIRLMIASVLGLALFGWSPVSSLLLAPLEDRFPPWDSTGGAPNGFVVLGGVTDQLVSDARQDVAFNDAAERFTATVELARRFPQAKILIAAGRGRLIDEGPTEAEAAQRFFAAMGIASDRLLLEDRSRNTSENARFSKEMAKPAPGERWLLVTSAFHMPRSMGIFRREGFPIEPYPVDWRTAEAHIWQPFDRISSGLQRSDTAVREWVGLLIYWLTGRTSELFPGPADKPR